MDGSEDRSLSCLRRVHVDEVVGGDGAARLPDDGFHALFAGPVTAIAIGADHLRGYPDRRRELIAAPAGAIRIGGV